MADHRQLSFVLALVGGIFAAAMGLMMALMGAVLTAALPTAPNGPPAGFFVALFSFFAVFALAGGVTMIVASVRVRKAPLGERGPAVACIVGGGLALLGGNVLAAGLGIAAGVVLLTSSQTGAPMRVTP